MLVLRAAYEPRWTHFPSINSSRLVCSRSCRRTAKVVPRRSSVGGGSAAGPCPGVSRRTRETRRRVFFGPEVTSCVIESALKWLTKLCLKVMSDCKLPSHKVTLPPSGSRRHLHSIRWGPGVKPEAHAYVEHYDLPLSDSSAPCGWSGFTRCGAAVFDYARRKPSSQEMVIRPRCSRNWRQNNETTNTCAGSAFHSFK
jgi:hypothetical protein